MNLIENIFTIQPDGSLLLPKKYLEEFSLSPGEQATISFLTEDCQSNTHHELPACPALTAPYNAQPLFISNTLLWQANLSMSVGLQIICLPKAIIIYEAEKCTVEGLLEKLDGLGIAFICIIEHSNKSQTHLAMKKSMTINFRKINKDVFAIESGQKCILVTKEDFAGLSTTVFLQSKEKRGTSKSVKKTLLNKYKTSEFIRSGLEKSGAD